jgi:hypothetical protein
MKIIVIGYGRFGHIAAGRLRESFPNRLLIVVDHDPDKLSDDMSQDTLAIDADATRFLLHSKVLEPEDVVVPMVPFHLAAAYVVAKSPAAHEMPIPVTLFGLVPNPHRMGISNLLASRANFVCPDDCPEGQFCTVTGLPSKPLHSTLAQITVPEFSIVVQRSRQILPGVGGYPMSDLLKLSEQLVNGRNILATSCRCHAVLTAIRKP